jgi:hypothetical protein
VLGHGVIVVIAGGKGAPPTDERPKVDGRAHELRRRGRGKDDL